MGGEKEKGGRESEEEVGEVHRSSGRGVAVGEVQGAEAEAQPLGDSGSFVWHCLFGRDRSLI